MSNVYGITWLEICYVITCPQMYVVSPFIAWIFFFFLP